MNWKKLSCAAVTALGLSACGGGTGADLYEGRITAVAIYPERTQAFSRADIAMLLGNDQALEVSLNPDICDLTGVRDEQGRLTLDAGARCQIHHNLAPREGTFIAVITEQSVIDTGGALALQLRGTIHAETAEAASEGELVLTFQGQLQ